MTLSMQVNFQPWRVERDLARDIAAGDVAAFEEVYAAYSRAIYTYLVSLVKDRATAEDLLQETFLALWSGAGRFRGQCAMRGWLFKIGHHQAMSWWRKWRPVYSLDDEEAGDRYEAIADPKAAARLEWTKEDLRAALAQLSPKHREVIELAFTFDMTQDEISTVIGCPVGTVKSRMSYALRHLKRLMASA